MTRPVENKLGTADSQENTMLPGKCHQNSGHFTEQCPLIIPCEQYNCKASRFPECIKLDFVLSNIYSTIQQ